jgi:hypothetical protein
LDTENVISLGDPVVESPVGYVNRRALGTSLYVVNPLDLITSKNLVTVMPPYSAVHLNLASSVVTPVTNNLLPLGVNVAVPDSTDQVIFTPVSSVISSNP